MRNRLFKLHDKALSSGEKGGGGGAYNTEFARYGLLERDVIYCDTNLPTFWRNSLASSSLVEIYRPLEACSVFCIRYRVGLLVRRL